MPRKLRADGDCRRHLLEDAELVIGEPAFSEVYGRSLTEIALTAGGQTYSIFVQTAEEIQPDDIIVRGA